MDATSLNVGSFNNTVQKGRTFITNYQNNNYAGNNYNSGRNKFYNGNSSGKMLCFMTFAREQYTLRKSVTSCMVIPRTTIKTLSLMDTIMDKTTGKTIKATK